MRDLVCLRALLLPSVTPIFSVHLYLPRALDILDEAIRICGNSDMRLPHHAPKQPCTTKG